MNLPSKHRSFHYQVNPVASPPHLFILSSFDRIFLSMKRTFGITNIDVVIFYLPKKLFFILIDVSRKHDFWQNKVGKWKNLDTVACSLYFQPHPPLSSIASFFFLSYLVIVFFISTIEMRVDLKMYSVCIIKANRLDVWRAALSKLAVNRTDKPADKRNWRGRKQKTSNDLRDLLISKLFVQLKTRKTKSRRWFKFKILKRDETWSA